MPKYYNITYKCEGNLDDGDLERFSKFLSSEKRTDKIEPKKSKVGLLKRIWKAIKNKP